MHYGSLISIRFFLAPIQRITHKKFRNFSRVKGRAWIIVELRHKRRVTSLHYITLHNVVGLLNASADAYSYRERNWQNATVAITTSQVVMATWLVQETEIQISVRGERHLGTVIGNDEYGKEYYSSQKVCLQDQGYDLNKAQFWDALRTRYNWVTPRTPSECSYGAKFNLVYYSRVRRVALYHCLIKKWEK